jgi:TadE-like protein
VVKRVARLLRRSEVGAVLVEFALVAPIVLLMLFAMVDLGKAYNYWIDQTHLANEGARWAAVNNWPGRSSSGGPTLASYILQQAETPEQSSGGTSSLPSPAQVLICFPNGGTPAAGDPVTVTVYSNYNFIPLVSSNIGLGRQEIISSSTMRLEAAPTAYSQTATTYDPDKKRCTVPAT